MDFVLEDEFKKTYKLRVDRWVSRTPIVMITTKGSVVIPKILKCIMK